MDLTDCCKAVETELADWRERFLDVSCKFDRLGSSELQKILPNVEDVHMLLYELEDRIEQLKSDCRTESDNREVEEFHTGFREVYEEAMAYIGGGHDQSLYLDREARIG